MPHIGQAKRAGHNATHRAGQENGPSCMPHIGQAKRTGHHATHRAGQEKRAIMPHIGQAMRTGHQATHRAGHHNALSQDMCTRQDAQDKDRM
jgi:hypothetical protein